MDHTILDQRLNDLPASVWQKIAHIDELKGQWIGGVKLGPQVLGRLKKSVIVQGVKRRICSTGSNEGAGSPVRWAVTAN